MLTRDLLLYRVRKGVVHPAYVDPEDPPLVELADRLVKVVTGAEGQERGDLLEELNGIAVGHKKPRLAKGLVKILLDRMAFQEPTEDAFSRRTKAFARSAAVARALSDGTGLAGYEAALADAFDEPLDDLRDNLYSDLLEHRRLEAIKAIDGRGLLHRYNLALVQGVVMFARRLVLTFADTDVVVVRRILRWMKFCRLVTDVSEASGGGFHLTVEGPAAILESAKKYGLQLAMFAQIVPLSKRFVLEADVELPRRPPAVLRVSEEQGLVCPLAAGVGHVPEEVTAALAGLESDDGWTPDLTPAPRSVGAKGWCVPDLRFVRSEDGVEVVVELFHAWHDQALLRRLSDLESRPDPDL